MRPSVYLFIFLFLYSAGAVSCLAQSNAPNEIAQLRAEIQRLSERLEVLEQQAQQQTNEQANAVLPLKAVPEEGPKDYIALSPYWHEGLHIVSADKAFDISIGGRLHLDAAVISGDAGLRSYLAERDGSGLHNGSEIRRAQLHVKGTLYTDLYYKMEYNFSGGGSLGDCFLQWNSLPVIDQVLIGKASRAFGLGDTPSSNYQIFMESPALSIFGGGGLGLAVGGGILRNRMSWAAQLYGNTDGDGLETDAEPNLNLRLTGLPWYEDKGRRMFHLGLSYKYADENDALSYKQRPDSHLAPYFVNTGDIRMSGENVLGYDAALCLGPFSLEGEYNAVYIQQKTSAELSDPDDLFFHGYYLTGSWFLTGERRGNQYMTGWGAFDSRARPLHNFSLQDGTWGAWQLAARYSGLMLNDANIEGGEMATFTTGLNWYWNSTTRLMFNYVHSHLNGAGNADIGEARLHMEF
ncbi:MAG: porin [Kiritimatiellae bacterium]|nr:porin [Kiritimatiellia bacterium]MDD4737253.1 porin [Kiritimatiellia bacterium]